MKKSKITIEKDLIDDLKKYASTVCVSLAGQVRDELYETARYAIEEFYNDYSPLYYKRHFYNFKEKSFFKYYKNPHNSIIRGGIELSSEQMDDIYRAETEYVFDLVYHGFHGNVEALPRSISNIPPVMNPSPLDILYDKRDYLIENIDDYSDVAIEKANKNSYNTLTI